MKFYPGDKVRHKFIKSPEVFEVTKVTPEGRVILRGNRSFGPVDPGDLVLIRRERDDIVACREAEDSEFGWVGRKEDENHPIIGVSATLRQSWEETAELLAPRPALKFGDRVHVTGREGVCIVVGPRPDLGCRIMVAHEAGEILFVKPEAITLIVEGSK